MRSSVALRFPMVFLALWVSSALMLPAFAADANTSPEPSAPPRSADLLGELKSLQLQLLQEGARRRLAVPWRKRNHALARARGWAARPPRDRTETGGPQGVGRRVDRARVLEGADRQVNDLDDLNPLSTQSEVSISGLGDHLVAAWNDGGGRTGAIGFGWSIDGGDTWIDAGDLPLGGTVIRWVSDPVVTVNERTRSFYFVGMAVTGALESAIAVVRGEFQDGALSWGTPVAIRAVRDTLPDKPWAAADSLTGNLYVSYTTFFRRDGVSTGQIEFQRVAGDLSAWTAPAKLSSARDDGLVQGSRPAVGPAGEVHVTWMAVDTTRASGGVDHLRHRTSGDGGASFSPEQDVASVFANFGSGAPGYDRGYGLLFPSIAVDRTHGPFRGRVYVAWNEGLNYFDDAPGDSNPRFEIEPNDEPANATRFNLGEFVRGRLSANDDVEYFRFIGMRGHTVFIYLDSLETELDASLRLLCGDGATRLAFSAPVWTGRSRVVVFTLPRSGPYYLRIAGFGGTEGAYRLRTGIALPGPERARDHRDVFVAWRDPGGSWSEPARMSDDAAWYDGWFPEVGVSPDGSVVAAWYDWRDGTDFTCGAASHVYAARSTDGGATWSSLGALSAEATGWTDVGSNLSPNQGDYIGLHAGDGGVAVAWADGRYGNPDVFFRRVDASKSGPLPYAPAVAIERLTPNPTTLTFRADLALAGDPNARLEVADLAGRIVHRQDLGAFGPGRHSAWVTLANVPAGVYWVRVVEGERSQAKRIALVK